MPISAADRLILRDLAKKQLELSASSRNQQLWKDWMEHGSPSVSSRPMIRIELNTFEHQLLPDMMKCEGEQAREIERRLLRPMINFSLFEDDTLVPDHYAIKLHSHFVPFGLKVLRQETDGLGHHFIPYLHDLEKDDPLLGASVFGIDLDATLQEQAEAEELLGDLLPVRRVTDAAYSCPMQDIVHIMNMDDLYMAMVDDEERFCHMLDRLVDDYLTYFRLMESSGSLISGARMQHLCQGSYCFTNELQDGIEQAKLKDLWLFMDSQETAGISPAMYRDLVFPSYQKLMNHFGLISYGCCEPVHAIWDHCLSTLPHLRKVSISPWCDEAMMGERLRGTGITYLRKPPATLLGMDTPELDETAVLDCFRKTAEAAKGCKLEIAQRDVYMVGHSAQKVKRYVELARIGLEG